jgi:hypothetical protein
MSTRAVQGRSAFHPRRGADSTRRRRKRTSEIHREGDDIDTDGLRRNPAARQPVCVRARHGQQQRIRLRRFVCRRRRVHAARTRKGASSLRGSHAVRVLVRTTPCTTS